jgi:hypothetical protein
MKRRTTKITAPRTRALLGVLLAYGSVVAACSGSPKGDICGPGTTEQDGECVTNTDGDAASSADGRDSSVVMDGGTHDVGAADGLQPPDAPIDSAVSDGLPFADAPPESAEAEGPPDQCYVPNFYYMSCDPSCPGPADAGNMCAMATCGPSIAVPVASPSQSPNGFSTIRTPNAPGTDPNCATQCPGGGFAYGIGLAVTDNPYPFTVAVSPPWVVFAAFANAPFCPGSAPSSCLAIKAATTTTVNIMTTDPNAPARNVTFSIGADKCP